MKGYMSGTSSTCGGVSPSLFLNLRGGVEKLAAK
jgi:hypothetical protein